MPACSSLEVPAGLGLGKRDWMRNSGPHGGAGLAAGPQASLHLCQLGLSGCSQHRASQVGIYLFWLGWGCGREQVVSANCLN